MQAWHSLFCSGESPYFSMFRAGCLGVALDKVVAHCKSLGIPLREKDIRSWQDGHWQHQMSNQASVLNPLLHRPTASARAATMNLHEFEKWPHGWTGTDKRWFPCTETNTPMQRWGYTKDFQPSLYDRASAEALSPIGWVGQNMYAQPFVVFDIDGVGHGERDEQVIAFGNQFRDLTETWESPAKRGSFHLYFNTPYRIPIAHYAYAKLDVMGNQKNAAVYMKDKMSNGLPRAVLTEDIWEELKAYVKKRKAQRDELIQQRKGVTP